MALPKNFQQTVNLNKRTESLNDLTFYIFTYNVVLTDSFLEDIYKDESIYDSIEENLGKFKFGANKNGVGQNRVYALNKEQAYEKINIWLDKAISNNIITEYNITEVVEKSFVEEINDMGLSPFLK